MMSNFPKSVHFEPELHVLPLVQQLGAWPIQRIGRRSLSCGLTLTACWPSCIMPLLLLQLGQLVVVAHNWCASHWWWRLCVWVFILLFGCLWWRWLRDGFCLSKFVQERFLVLTLLLIVNVGWRLECSHPPAWNEKRRVSAVDNCKPNQIECSVWKNPSYKSLGWIKSELCSAPHTAGVGGWYKRLYRRKGWVKNTLWKRVV